MSKWAAIALLGLVLLAGCTLLQKCPESCDDGNFCTYDYCSAESDYKCAHTLLDGTQNGCSGDFESCKTRICKAGTCSFEFKLNCCGNTLCESPEDYASCKSDCPDCDDKDQCTLDTYDYSLKKCVNTQITPCCGDRVCVGKESGSCPNDCPVYIQKSTFGGKYRETINFYPFSSGGREITTTQIDDLCLGVSDDDTVRFCEFNLILETQQELTEIPRVTLQVIEGNDLLKREPPTPRYYGYLYPNESIPKYTEFTYETSFSFDTEKWALMPRERDFTFVLTIVSTVYNQNFTRNETGIIKIMKE